MTIFPFGRATWLELALASVACGTTVAVVGEDTVAWGCVAAVTVVAACGVVDNWTMLPFMFNTERKEYI